LFFSRLPEYFIKHFCLRLVDSENDGTTVVLGDPAMRIEILQDADAVARHAADLIAAAARAAVSARGRFVLAVSGGSTPWQMLRALASEELPWQGVHLAQVDERVAPPGDPDRNLTHLRESLFRAPLRPEQIHAMPVDESDLDAAARQYAKTLEQLAGSPLVLDLVHLGLGPDGHTASLVPDDPVLAVTDADVAPTAGIYQGRRRLTLTYPPINRARAILWLVTGESKADMLLRLRDRDPSIPAGRVSQVQATVLADRAAASKLK
jgi:6-phosphogluconolactonase